MPESQSEPLFALLIVSVAMETALAVQCEVEEELVVLQRKRERVTTGRGKERVTLSFKGRDNERAHTDGEGTREQGREIEGERHSMTGERGLVKKGVF